MYLHINCLFYEEGSGKKIKKANNYELQDFSRSMDDISTAMSNTCYFLDAVRTLKQHKIKFDTSKLHFNP